MRHTQVRYSICRQNIAHVTMQALNALVNGFELFFAVSYSKPGLMKLSVTPRKFGYHCSASGPLYYVEYSRSSNYFKFQSLKYKISKES